LRRARLRARNARQIADGAGHTRLRAVTAWPRAAWSSRPATPVVAPSGIPSAVHGVPARHDISFVCRRALRHRCA
jgi:hypothetical protein